MLFKYTQLTQLYGFMMYLTATSKILKFFFQLRTSW